MLVLSRKAGESIQVGEDITVTVVRIYGGAVRIGVEAPSGVMIFREELGPGQENHQPLRLQTGDQAPPHSRNA